MNDDVRDRLSQCFRVVFPNLPEEEVRSASQETVQDWDSMAAITLVSVIQEEFHVELDLEKLAELNSFNRILVHLNQAGEVS